VSLLEIEEKVANLSKSERLQMMEVLWNAIRKDEPESPAWHGEILAARLAKVEAGKGEFLTLSDLKKRLGR
jgi:putative addiction module component (TIGR02574 family)